MRIIYFFCCLMAAAGLSSCNKYLDAKPDKTLVVPATVQDFQAILDNTTKMNRYYPFTTELAADNIYLTTADWNARTATQHNVYIWDKDVFNDNEQNDWFLPYVIVYYANVVLDKAAAVNGTENVRGQALFFRSYAFYELLQVFAQPYGSNAAAVAGIPLRLSPDLNIPTARANLQQCCDQIIADTKKAAALLPVTQLFKTRPSKAAAYGLLARTYLTMYDYPAALLYADSALQLNNTLMDFNSLNAAAAAPVALFNTEDLFHAALNGATALTQAVAKVDSNLYRSYQLNDLRRTVFFKDNGNGSYAFKGSYEGSDVCYNGLAVDEMYLIRAECLARTGQTNAAMNDLNTLMLKRWKAGTFVAFTATDNNDALVKIITERRKELLMRGLRWTDLKRLNKEQQFAVTLTRFVNNTTYTLPPDDSRYTLQIPVAVINLTGIEQNP